MFFKTACLLLLVPAIVLGSGLQPPFSNCSPNDPPPQGIRIPNCNEQFCRVTRNQPASMQVLFQPQSEIPVLTTACRAFAAGFWVPWRLGDQSNVCTHLLNGECPLRPHQNAVYGFQITIPRIAPIGARVVVEIRAATPERRTVFCFRVNVLVES